MENLNNFEVNNMSYVALLTSSKGAQKKFYQDGYFYKLDKHGREGLVERLSSIVLSESNIENYVTYEQCLINGKNGCRSFNFLKENEGFVSIQRLYDFHVGCDIGNQLYQMQEAKDRIAFTLDFIKEITNLDAKDYLGKMLSFDALILNTDRHFHNIGFIINSKTDQFSYSPIFDNGNALLSDYGEFPHFYSLDENILKVSGKPFLSNLEMQAYLFDFPLKLNYKNIEQKLQHEPPCREIEVLRFQMEKYRNIFES
ncbi:MAG: hypothetical protein R3Y24_15190 [Eubacteriales bacterium]